MPAQNLTDSVVRNLSKGSHWDKKLRGFGVRVSPTGTKTFVVLIASGRRKSLGHYPLVSLQNAREQAARILAEKTLGKVDPTRTAFDDAKADYLAECASKNKPRTVRDYARLLAVHYPFARTAIGNISGRDIVRKLNRANSAPSEKHHAYAAGNTFFEWCRHQHLINANPMANLEVKPTGKSRKRILDDTELVQLLRIVSKPTNQYEAILYLLILTGQRPGEIKSLEWGWVGSDTIRFPDTKNNLDHRFPIGPMTLAALAHIENPAQSPYVFPAKVIRKSTTTTFNSWSKSKSEFDKKLNIAPWTNHDLRRTFRTKWAQLGTSREVAERYINHVSGAHSGIVGVYDRYSYLPEMKRAVEVWEAHLHTLLAG